MNDSCEIAELQVEVERLKNQCRAYACLATEVLVNVEIVKTKFSDRCSCCLMLPNRHYKIGKNHYLLCSGKIADLKP